MVNRLSHENVLRLPFVVAILWTLGASLDARAQTEAVDPAAIGIRTPAERMTERVGVPDNYRVPNAWRRRVAEDWAYDIDRRSTLDPYEPHGAGEILGSLDDSGRAAF